jgi:outer membrane receptor protein involved in Fe transport
MGRAAEATSSQAEQTSWKGAPPRGPASCRRSSPTAYLAYVLLFAILAPCLSAASGAARPAEAQDSPAATEHRRPSAAEAGETEDGSGPIGPVGPKSRDAADPNVPEAPEGRPEELLLFDDVPVVVSAARQAQPANWLSVPVSIITAEDIHYSGLTSLPDILQFAPSVDLLRLQRNRFAVGVRGMHFAYSDRLLSLVDGRAADNPMFGGPDFLRLPILLEDIKRIEVVRGPGGAAWGANAFTGVLNIITKEPEDCLGWFGTTTWSHYGDSYSHVRWADKADKWSWRVSLGHIDQKSSEDALSGGARFINSQAGTGPLIGFGRFEARDFTRNWRFDGKAVYKASDRTKWSFGTGYSHLETGDFERAGYYAMDNTRYDSARLFTKAEHNFGDGRSAHFQWFGNFLDGGRGGEKQRAFENDLEAQYNFPLAEGHELSVGGNVRWTHIQDSYRDAQDMRFADEPFNEYWLGLFAIDRWQLTRRLVLEGQVRADWYSETHCDWSSRLSALYALDEGRRHVLRVSGAKAFRTPLVVLREMTGKSVPLGGGTYLLEYVLPDDELKNEQTWSVEAGYTGKLTDWLTVRADGYFQRFERLISYVPTVRPPLPTKFAIPENTDGASSFGGELEIELKHKMGKLSAWYAYNGFQEELPHQDIRSFVPARHKMGLRGRLFLPDGWTFNANYRYATATYCESTGGEPRPGLNRLDLTVSKKLFDGHCELMFGVTDVLDKNREPVVGFGQFTAHETPGRMFFGRLQWKF